MQIEVTNSAKASRYEIFVDGELAGFADYKVVGTTIAFPHTEINPKFGGRGLGSNLIEFALNQVGKEGLSVAPICPFVAAYIGKNPDRFLDLVPIEKRPKYGL